MKTIHPSLDGNFSKDIEVISIGSLGYQSVGSSRQIKKSLLRKKKTIYYGDRTWYEVGAACVLLEYHDSVKHWNPWKHPEVEFEV
jgi:hypothetical protein